jgi:phosphatidylinositol-3-phosphatase
MRPLCAVAVLSAAIMAAVGAGTGVARAAIPVGSPCSKVTPRRYTHVVVVAFENHSYQSILGPSAPASYFKTLAAHCGSATDFTAAHFPRSLPNYLAVTSGSTAGITGDCTPAPGCNSPNRSIFQQVGRSQWRAWGESMPTACDEQNTSLYVPRHLAAMYYTRILHSTCLADARPLPTPFPDVRRKFVWVAPDLVHDMHNGTPAQASAWLFNFLAGPQGLLRSPSYQAGHTAIFIWFDSGDASSTITTPIPLIVVAPTVGHRTITTHLTDYHLLHGWEGLLGLPCLNAACHVSGFDARFNL